MNQELIEGKNLLRGAIRSRLEGLSASDRLTRSTSAVALLLQQPVWREAESVLLYAPMGNELDIWPALLAALKEGKLVSLPRFDSGTRQYVACRLKDPTVDLLEGQYGIREPAQHCESVALNQLDFALVPGVAFDLHGRRLGRGKGYYDRMLAEMRGKTCGVAFDEQIVREVPVQPHDSEVNCILTPTRWLAV